MADGRGRVGDPFEARSREIKEKAVATFFDERRHPQTLERQFPKTGRHDQLRHLREYPYKFGVRMILADRGSERSADYHRAKATREGFELLKVLHDQADLLTVEEAEYVRTQINSCVNDKTKDFSSLLLELDLCRSARERCDAVSIGDGSAAPDVSLVAAGRRYEVQCKSVGGGEQESRALRGFCSLLNSLAIGGPKLAAAARHSAWQVHDPSLFASAITRLSRFAAAWIPCNRAGSMRPLLDGSSMTWLASTLMATTGRALPIASCWCIAALKRSAHRPARRSMSRAE